MYLAGALVVFAFFMAALNYYVERVQPRREPRRKPGDKVEAHGLPAPESGGECVPPAEPPDWR